MIKTIHVPLDQLAKQIAWAKARERQAELAVLQLVRQDLPPDIGTTSLLAGMLSASLLRGLDEPRLQLSLSIIGEVMEWPGECLLDWRKREGEPT